MMMFRRALVVVIVAAVAVVTLWLWRVAPDAPAPTGQAPERVAVRLTGATVVLRRNGARQAEIAAERVEVSADRRTTAFAGHPRVVFFEYGEPTVSANASRIVLDNPSRFVRAEGGLRISTVGGDMLTAQSGFLEEATGAIELTGATLSAAVPGPRPSAAPRGQFASAAGLGQLRADHVRYDSRARVIVARGDILLVTGDVELRADQLRVSTANQTVAADGNVSVRRRGARLLAPTLRYDMRTETADAVGGVVLEEHRTTVQAPQMRFDLGRSLAVASGGVVVTHGQTVVSALKVRYDAGSAEVTAEGDVVVTRPGSRAAGQHLFVNLRRQQADLRVNVLLVHVSAMSTGGAAASASEEMVVTAGRLVFRWDASEAEAEENVQVALPGRIARADRMVYLEATNSLVLAGRVVLDQASDDRSARGGTLFPASGEQRGIASHTRMTCTSLTMSLRERDITADGPLTVTLRDRRVSGDHATYTEASRRLVVSGNVRLQEADGQRLRADRVVISLVDETIEADGNVLSEFVIRPYSGGSSSPTVPSPTATPSP